MGRNKIHILLVEDDPNLSLLLRDYLELQGYYPVLCINGEEGLEEFKSQEFNLCILDVMMPKKDGFTLAQDIRRMNSGVPIIFLTAKSMIDDRLKGFTIGCDDYITKPFSTEELSLRIKAIMKRCEANVAFPVKSDDGIYKIGIFTLDHDNFLLKSASGEKHLTRKESSLLKLLCEYQNQVVSRELALTRIWGGNNYFIGRSMDVFIAKLRKYLRDDPSIAIINVHGTGFKLLIEETSPVD